MNRKSWSLGLLLVLMLFLNGCVYDDRFTEEVNDEKSPEENGKTIISGQKVGVKDASPINFIIANPLNLSQIKRISKFRSCVGHDYSGKNTEGEKETLRSMKHYIEPFPYLIGTDQIQIFAPFKGVVVKIEDSGHGSSDQQMWIKVENGEGWNFIFFHVSPSPEIKEGVVVKAGQKVGIVSKEVQHNFDIGLKKFSFQGQIFDSPFLHMSDTVLKEYKIWGITPEAMIISKKWRDEHPCPLQDTTEEDARFSSYNDDDFVVLGKSEDLKQVTKDVAIQKQNSGQLGGMIIQQQKGVTFEHYFPNTASLKSDESEILVYNEGAIAVQITAADMKFILGEKIYEQYSGTWEKFPSAQSWERVEYINIKPGYYELQPLILEPGQKGKLHWHYQFMESVQGKEQAVDIEISYSLGSQHSTLKKRVIREENDAVSETGQNAENEGH